jgi:hypothetical protein
LFQKFVASVRVEFMFDQLGSGEHQSLARADFEIALQLASELDFLFENGDSDERRLLCETLFKQVGFLTEWAASLEAFRTPI